MFKTNGKRKVKSSPQLLFCTDFASDRSKLQTVQPSIHYLLITDFLQPRKLSVDISDDIEHQLWIPNIFVDFFRRIIVYTRPVIRALLLFQINLLWIDYCSANKVDGASKLGGGWNRGKRYLESLERLADSSTLYLPAPCHW